MDRSERVLNSAVVAVASVLFAALAWLPIGRVRVGEGESTFSLRDLVGLGYAVSALGVLLGVVAVVQLWRGTSQSVVAGWGFGVLGILTFLSILLIEGVGKLIPRSLLPATLRRFVFNLGVTATPWVAVTLAAAACVASFGRTRSAMSTFERAEHESSGMYFLRAAGVVVALAGIVVMAVSRSAALALVSYPGGQISVETWAIPWVGPGSLLMVVALVLCLMGLVSGRATGIFGAFGAALAWVSAATTGLMVATSGLLVDTGAVEWVIDQLDSAELPDRLSVLQDVTITANSGPVAGYVGTCLAAAGFTAALSQRQRVR